MMTSFTDIEDARSQFIKLLNLYMQARILDVGGSYEFRRAVDLVACSAWIASRTRRVGERRVAELTIKNVKSRADLLSLEWRGKNMLGIWESEAP